MRPDAGVPPRDAWSDYWESGSTGEAMPDDHPGTRALTRFWDQRAEELAGGAGGRLVDLACGGGFVTQRLTAALAERDADWQLLALDVAEPAVRQLCTASGGALQGVVGDAARLPIAAGSMDAVVSQFGLEYAGRDALLDVAALLAPGGQLVLLSHHAEGTIAQGCRDNARVLAAMRDSGLLQGMRGLFTLLDAPGTGGRRDLNRINAALRRARQATATLVRTGPGCAAMPWVRRLCQDVSQVYERAGFHDPAAVLQWLRSIDDQLNSYHGRMQGMVSAALTEKQVASVTSAWQQQGLSVREAGALEVDARPLAWQLMAVRSAA